MRLALAGLTGMRSAITSALLTTAISIAPVLQGSAAVQGADPQPRPYVIYDTGIVCRSAPCFSYCARDLGTNEVRRFSQLAPFTLSKGEHETLRTTEPVIVKGTLRSVGSHIPPAVEMTVLQVVRRAPELLSRPARCE